MLQEIRFSANNITNGDDILTTCIWLILTVLFAAVEALTVQLVCIWFAGGALMALIFGVLGFNIWVQGAVFLVTSGILLLVTRPIVKRLLSGKNVETNLDRVVGKSITILEVANENASSGKSNVNGIIWSVRSEDGSALEIGESVTVARIEGVNLIVKR